MRLKSNTASASSAAMMSARRRPKRSASAPAIGADRTAPTMLTDMKSEVMNSETPKRSCTKARSTVTGIVTGTRISTASRPRQATRQFS